MRLIVRHLATGPCAMLTLSGVQSSSRRWHPLTLCYVHQFTGLRWRRSVAAHPQPS